MSESKAKQVVTIWQAKGQTVCIQYIMIKLFNELLMTISIFHKRDWESHGLTTDTSAYRNSLSSPHTICS